MPNPLVMGRTPQVGHLETTQVDIATKIAGRVNRTSQGSASASTTNANLTAVFTRAPHSGGLVITIQGVTPRGCEATQSNRTRAYSCLPRHSEQSLSEK